MYMCATFANDTSSYLNNAELLYFFKWLSLLIFYGLILNVNSLANIGLFR